MASSPSSAATLVPSRRIILETVVVVVVTKSQLMERTLPQAPRHRRPKKVYSTKTTTSFYLDFYPHKTTFSQLDSQPLSPLPYVQLHRTVLWLTVIGYPAICIAHAKHDPAHPIAHPIAASSRGIYIDQPMTVSFLSDPLTGRSTVSDVLKGPCHALSGVAGEVLVSKVCHCRLRTSVAGWVGWV